MPHWSVDEVPRLITAGELGITAFQLPFVRDGKGWSYVSWVCYQYSKIASRGLGYRMRFFGETLRARFISRPNRFLIRCGWRGARHLEELAALSGHGLQTTVLFIVHWPFARVFMPDYHADLHFSQTLLRVREKVQVLPLAVRWNADLSLRPSVGLLKIPWDFVEREAQDRGSYLLLLNLRRGVRIPVGSLGTVHFEKGFYIYVGSAMANLTRRMDRHRRLLKRHHWHIDELRAVAEFHASLAIRSSTRLECEIARALLKIAGWSIPGFGCSDCDCPTHLLGMSKDPLQSPRFHRLVQYFRMDRCMEAMG